MKHISQQHLKHLREHGYAIIEDFLTPEELAAAQKELRSTFPSLIEYQYAPTLYREAYSVGYAKHLPFLGDFLNFMAVSPKIVAIAEQVLGTKKMTLVTSHVWAKYAGEDDYDMALHTDYSSSTLLYPNKRAPLAKMITFILYYVDVDERLGPTYVVSEQHSKDELLVPDIRPASEYPELYRHERPVNVRAGSLLLYTMTAFHRGSAITSKDRVRYSHHMTYQSDDAPWMGYNVWAKNSLSPEMQHFIGQASPRQRELFGFPPLGHPYWNRETLRGVAARYPTADMTPYIEATGLSKRQKDELCEQLQQPLSNDKGRGAADYFDGQTAKGIQQLAATTAYDYYRKIADYYATVSGVAADYWLPWLLAYSKGSS